MDKPVSIAIVIDDALVSQDVVDTFAFWEPATFSRTFDTVAQARIMPSNEFDPGLVFVAARDGVLVTEGPDLQWLLQRKVITLDLRDRKRFPLWQHLSRPFTQAQVIEAAYRLYDSDDRERVGAE